MSWSALWNPLICVFGGVWLLVVGSLKVFWEQHI